MEAIEVTTKTDENGMLELKMALPRKNSKVRILILLQEELESIRERFSRSDAMDFWIAEEEDLYQDFIKNKKT